MEHKFLTSLCVGDIVEGFYLLRAAYPKTATNGKPFLNATISDNSGNLDAKVWDYSGPISDADNGKVIHIKGKVNEFRGAEQVIIETIRLAEDGDVYSLDDLIPSAPINQDEAFRQVKDMLLSLQDPDYRRISLDLLAKHQEKFKMIPAAKSVHHGFIHGLLMHTWNMMKLADFLAGQYADIVDRSLLVAGTFAHDLQKETEFLFSDLGLVTEYSAKGNLLGHLVMGAFEIGELTKELNIPEEKGMLLQHMVLSHHGQPDMGAAVRPMVAEAELLSLIDMIDSQMEIYKENYAEMDPGEVSGKIFALDKKIYKKK